MSRRRRGERLFWIRILALGLLIAAAMTLGCDWLHPRCRDRSGWVCRADIGARQLDYLVFATMTPDYYFPGSAPFLQRKIGLRQVPCLDIRQQCAGFIYGLQLADAVVRSGQHPNVLVVGSEVHSALINWKSWDVVFDTNLKGPFFLAQLAANEMLRLIDAGTIPNGKIINVSSISAYTVSVNRADYCMTKAAMGMMTALFAVRLAEYGIGVYEIRPGITKTDMTAVVKGKYDQLISEGLVPIARWGLPKDIGKAVAALCKDYFPFSTGEVFNVDGGFHLRIL